MRPCSYSVNLYIIRRASTSDGVQCSDLETLYCTPSNALAFPKI